MELLCLIYFSIPFVCFAAAAHGAVKGSLCLDSYYEWIESSDGTELPRYLENATENVNKTEV